MTDSTYVCVQINKTEQTPNVGSSQSDWLENLLK